MNIFTGAKNIFIWVRNRERERERGEREKQRKREKKEKKREREEFVCYAFKESTEKCSLQVKLCGDQLIHMLGIICRSGRQGGRDSGASLTQEEGEDFDFEEHLHRRRRRGVSSTEQEVRGGGGSPHRRKRRDIIGLSTTCCMSSCTLRQLRLAC